MTFGKRLAEERKRLGMKQAEFAAMVGTDVPKQSLYENDRRELRGDLLARLAANGVDIHYVLTAERCEGAPLGEDATEMVSAFVALPPELRESLMRLVRDLRGHFE